jgi:hypothetical protein
LDELVARIVARTGLAPGVAEKAAGAIIGFLAREAPADKVAPLLAAIPELGQPPPRPGGFAAFLGGGLLGIYTELTGLGLGMPEIRASGEEFLAYAEEKAGADAVRALIGSVPGLAPLL